MKTWARRLLWWLSLVLVLGVGLQGSALAQRSSRPCPSLDRLERIWARAVPLIDEFGRLDYIEGDANRVLRQWRRRWSPVGRQIIGQISNFCRMNSNGCVGPVQRELSSSLKRMNDIAEGLPTQEWGLNNSTAEGFAKSRAFADECQRRRRSGLICDGLVALTFPLPGLTEEEQYGEPLREVAEYLHFAQHGRWPVREASPEQWRQTRLERLAALRERRGLLSQELAEVDRQLAEIETELSAADASGSEGEAPDPATREGDPLRGVDF